MTKNATFWRYEWGDPVTHERVQRKNEATATVT